MTSSNLPTATQPTPHTHDLLVYGEIIPVLPNFTMADLRVIGSDGARQEALATVLRAVDELLVGHGLSRQAITSQVEPRVSPAPPPFEERPPAVEPLAGEPLPGDSAARRRNFKTPLAIAAGLAIIAFAALVWPGPLSSRSTHVAATKTSTSLGPSKDAAPTAQPSLPASTPPPAAAPGPTVATPDDAVPDFTVEPLPTSPPTTKVVCPSGNVTAAVTQVQAQQSANDPSGWDMTITGTLRNGTNTSIDAPTIDVTITGSNGDEPAFGDADSSQLGPGQATSWTATTFVSSTTRPTATAKPDTWVWLDSHYADCPSGSSPPASAR